MKITIEWLNQQINSCRQQHEKHITSANIANGALQALQGVKTELLLEMAAEPESGESDDPKNM